MSRRIYFTVTNDLTYDQRMHRICTTLAEAGYHVTLVGRQRSSSIDLQNHPFTQKRLKCFFNKGMWFYAEYNIRLFFYLIFRKMDAICSIDLDTILAGLIVSKLKGVLRIYDAHEYFTELKEVRTRPFVKSFWSAVERYAIPQYPSGYTVSAGLAEAFSKRYNSKYEVIRNLPVLNPVERSRTADKFMVYQGAVNEARGFEYLIPAMQQVHYRLVVCGDGNYMQQLKQLIVTHQVADKVELKGMLLPGELRQVAATATLGIGLAEKEGVNQYHALPNKFLEYMHAGLPQIAMNFPEYARINSHYKIAVLLNDLDIGTIANTINQLMEDDDQLRELEQNAIRAREEYCWQNEQQLLLRFYKSILP